MARGLMFCEIKRWGTSAHCDTGDRHVGPVRAYARYNPQRTASFVAAMFSFMGQCIVVDTRSKLTGTQLEPLTWTALAGWTADDHLAAFAAYQRKPSVPCMKDRRTDGNGPMLALCRSSANKRSLIRPLVFATARTFFEYNFQPVRIARFARGETAF